MRGTDAIALCADAINDVPAHANPALMAQLAETSGGQTLAANDLRSLPDRVAQWQAEQQLVDKQSPLWDRGWLLLLAVGLLGIEWYSRRREGLL